LVSKTLGRIHKYSIELENELIDSVRQPLIDLSNAEVREGEREYKRKRKGRGYFCWNGVKAIAMSRKEMIEGIL